MTTFNSITGQGTRALASDVGSAGMDPEQTNPETEPVSTPDGPGDGVDAQLGPDTPQSLVFNEPAPPPPRPAVAPASGAGETVTGGGGGGPSGPLEQPAIPVAGPQKPTRRQFPPIVSGLGKEVDKLLNMSPTMRELFAKAKALGYGIEIRKDGANECDHEKGRIYINPNSLSDGHKLTSAELASLAAHEIDHAVRGPGRPILPLDREGFAAQSSRAELDREASAALTNARVRDEIKAAGGGDIGIRGGLDDRVIRIYEEGKNRQPPMTDQEIIAALVPVVAGEPRGRPDGSIGRTDQVFLEKYKAAYDALLNR
jgi:hypothetical protein